MEERILNSIKLRPGVSNNPDELLNDFISDAILSVKSYLNYKEDETIPVECESVVKELVIIKCNQLGAEGLVSQGTSGISETYVSDIPRPLKKILNRYRKIRW